MSRFEEYDGDGDDAYNGNGWAMWEKRAQLAIEGKRGRKALGELREALLALPEKRLISRALCTVGGAFSASGRIRSAGGMSPDEAFAALPTVADIEGDGGSETARIGKDHGLTFTLAWELAQENDDTWAELTPEARYEAFLKWIDEQLAKPPLRAPERGAKARRRAARDAARAEASAAERARQAAKAGQVEMGLQQ